MTLVEKFQRERRGLVSADKTLIDEFLDAYLMNAATDYKTAHRAELDGKRYAMAECYQSPKAVKNDIAQFFIEWFGDADTVRLLLKELRRQAEKDGRRGRKKKGE